MMIVLVLLYSRNLGMKVSSLCRFGATFVLLQVTIKAEVHPVALMQKEVALTESIILNSGYY